MNCSHASILHICSFIHGKENGIHNISIEHMIKRMNTLVQIMLSHSIPFLGLCIKKGGRIMQTITIINIEPNNDMLYFVI